MEELYKKRLSNFLQTQNSSLKIACPAESENGPAGWGDGWKMQGDNVSIFERLQKEGSPPIGLGLGLGLELGSGSGDTHRCERFAGFTYLQLQELKLQALIYKYMEAGLPVPSQLMYPILESFSGCLGGIHHRDPYPSPTLFGWNPLHWGCKRRMDAEPGRCRRTDGKKWRCSRKVVPDRKYCERHVHRGRQRSRKLVEATAMAAQGSAADTSEVQALHPASNTNVSASLNQQQQPTSCGFSLLGSVVWGAGKCSEN